MKRIGDLLAVMVAAVVLATSAVALAATNVQSSPKQAIFRVTLNGFTVNNETFDNALELDGKGDEVYIRYDTQLVDNEGTKLLGSQGESSVMGDTNGWPTRVQAGSRSSLGGLKTGDTFPTSTPWIQSGDITQTQPPMKLFEGKLVKGKQGAAITPTIWEWDGGTDILQSWGTSISENAPEIAQSVANLINGSSDENDLIKTNLEMGLPAFFDLLSDIFGRAEDRPVGGVASGDNKTFQFNPKSLLLTYETASLATQTDFGFGRGVLAIQYTDPSPQTGRYTLYLQVQRVDTPPTIKSVRPGPDSQMTDRTPTIGATVRDAQTELGKSNISLSVDSQKITTFAYNQDTDKLTYTPSSKLSFGKHTVKVTARDASSLSTTRGWSFKIARPTG
jgi:hypothetical protein